MNVINFITWKTRDFRNWNTFVPVDIYFHNNHYICYGLVRLSLDFLSTKLRHIFDVESHDDILKNDWSKVRSELAFICSKSTTETPEQWVKSFQNLQQRHQNDIVMVSLLIILNRLHQVNASWVAIQISSFVPVLSHK